MYSFTTLFFVLFPFLACAQFVSKIPVETMQGWKYLDQDSSSYRYTYEEAMPYSSGLAAARRGAYFGYLNRSEQFIISPQFDVAYPFQGSFAMVGKDGKNWIINKRGEKIHSEITHPTELLANQFHLIIRESEKMGIKDDNGQWVVKPTFTDIQYDERGFYLLQQETENKINQFQIYTIGGNYHRSNDTIISARLIGHGLIGAIHKNGKNIKLVICNQQFSPVFSKNYTGEDILLMEALTSRLFYLPKKNDPKIHHEKYHGDFIYKRGEKPEANFQSFLLEKHWPQSKLANFRGKYLEIDHYGRIKSNYLYDQVNVNDHSRIFAVKINDKWYWKHKGDQSIHPLNENISYLHQSGIYQEVFFAELEDSEKPGWVLLNLNGEQLLEEHFEEVQFHWLRNGFIWARNGDQEYYISKEGRIIWSSFSSKNLKTLNISHQTPANAYLGKPESLRELPFKLKNKKSKYNLIFHGLETYQNNYQGHKLFLINNSKDTLILDTQDGRLYLILEALNSKGEWQPIQYFINSWCGNSYYRLPLPSKSFCQFTMPRFTGVFKTKVRARLHFLEASPDHQVNPLIYSNEIEMSINPGQFWVQRSYQTQYLMDPYGF